jgi:uncharacterized protein (DUF2252 family)
MEPIREIERFNGPYAEEKRQLKFRALRESAFRFLRGTCHLFYNRCSHLKLAYDPTKTWICGDLHLENFGTFKGDNRLIYFDINDFDESIQAPCSWDIIRLTSSIAIALQENNVSPKKSKALQRAAIKTYLKTLEQGKALMIERGNAPLVVKKLFKRLDKRSRNNFIKKHTTLLDAKRIIIIDKVHTHPLEAKDKLIIKLQDLFTGHDTWKNYKIFDLASRRAGTSSLVLDKYVLLVRSKINRKFYLIELKEAIPSSLRSHKRTHQLQRDHQADRIVELQQQLQFNSPALLGALKMNSTWYVVKELQPMEDKISATSLVKIDEWRQLIEVTAKLAAYAHVRTAGWQDSSTIDQLIAFSTQNDLLKKIASDSKKMIDQVFKDYRVFCEYYDQKSKIKVKSDLVAK